MLQWRKNSKTLNSKSNFVEIRENVTKRAIWISKCLSLGFGSWWNDSENIHIGCSGHKYGSEVKKKKKGINDNGNNFFKQLWNALCLVIVWIMEDRWKGDIPYYNVIKILSSL